MSVYTVDEIAQASESAIGISISTRRIYRWIQNGKLKALRVGGRVYVRSEDLEQLIPCWSDSDADA